MAITIYFVYKTANRLLDERAGRIAVVLLLGCLGLLERSHEMNAEIAGLAGFAIALYGLTRLRADPRRGGIVSAVGAGVMALAIGIVPALVVPLIALASQLFMRDFRNRDLTRGIVIMLVTMWPLLFWYPAVLWFTGIWGNLDKPALLGDMLLGSPLFSRHAEPSFSFIYFLQILPWFALPALPLAIWGWVKDRHKLTERVELALPLVAFVVTFIYFSCVREARFIAAFALLPPLALAGAYALDRLPRGMARLVDSFSLLFFGLLAVAAWFYWTAAVTGAPATAARKVAEQAPDFLFTFRPFPVIIAGVLTALWVVALIRAHRNNRRAIVNWAAGVTLIWVLANALALPAFDHVRSYRAVARDLMASMGNTRSCVIGVGIGDAQRASFDYFSNLRFATSAQSLRCDWLLSQGTRERTPALGGDWQLKWEGARPSDKVEKLRLYQRVKTPSAPK